MDMLHSILTGMVVLAFAATPVAAHEATHWQTGKGMGWEYDKDCCDGTDCAMLRPTRVEKTATGYKVTVARGEHPMLSMPHTFLIPYDSPNIRVSGDEFHHLCSSPDGYDYGEKGKPTIYCFYIPMIIGNRVLSHAPRG
jgi:hypothetical protein